MACSVLSTLLTTHPPKSLLLHQSSFSYSPSIFLLKKRTTRKEEDSKSHAVPRVSPLKSSRLWRISAAGSVDVIAPESVVEKAQEIAPATADGGTGSLIISGLLIVAFIGLSILTVGVIYIAVTDFLQKKEKEKFEKEDAAKKKKPNKKKAKVKARAAPRGFGVKVEEDEEE